MVGNNAKSFISSRNRNNKEIVSVLNYSLDETSDDEKVVLSVKYKRRLHNVEVQEKLTDEYDVPIGIGERYIVLENHVYFLKDASDSYGAFS